MTTMAAEKKAAAKPTYAQHVERERSRRTQTDYRRGAREQVQRERGERTDSQRAASQQRQQAFRDAGRSARQLGGSGDFKNYQGIILAEFIAAELLVAATPIASNRQTPGLSPYVPRDVTKLLAIGAVYFILELLSVIGSGWGKAGAAFGGLILLTVGINEASDIVADLDAFAGFTQKVSNAKQKVTGG